jgi:hypothetical protein
MSERQQQQLIDAKSFKQLSKQYGDWLIKFSTQNDRIPFEDISKLVLEGV